MLQVWSSMYRKHCARLSSTGARVHLSTYIVSAAQLAERVACSIVSDQHLYRSQ